MKETYTVPELSSLEDNRIIDLYNVDLIPEECRLLNLSGSAVRIKVTKDYIELNSVDDLDLKEYNEVFEKLMKFFYGDAYLFGTVNENKLEIYDVYTNDNYLSTRDLEFLKINFGLPIVTPAKEGKLTFKDIVSCYEEKGLWVILPSVYINDKREFETFKEDIKTNVIFGEKKTYVYSYRDASKPVTEIGKQKTSATTSVSEVKKEAEVKHVKKVFTDSTKEERTAIYKETLKNIEASLDKKKGMVSDTCLLWWKKYGKKFAYLYAIHTLPSTRQIVYDYANTYTFWDDDYLLNNINKWAILFLDFFYEEYDSYTNYDDYGYFSEIFEDELTEFDKFYKQENDLVTAKVDSEIGKLGEKNV